MNAQIDLTLKVLTPSNKYEPLVLIIRDSVFSGYDYNRNRDLNVEVKGSDDKDWILSYPIGGTEYSPPKIIENLGHSFIYPIPSNSLDGNSSLYGKDKSLDIRLRSRIYLTSTKEPIDIYSKTVKVKLPKSEIPQNVLNTIGELKNPYAFYSGSVGFMSWRSLKLYEVIRTPEKFILKSNEAFVSFNKHLITIAGNSQITDWAKLNLAHMAVIGDNPWRQQIEDTWGYFIDIDKSDDLLLLSSVSRFIGHLLSTSYPKGVKLDNYDDVFNPMPEDIKVLINKDEDLRVKLRDLNERIKAKRQVLIAKHYKR